MDTNLQKPDTRQSKCKTYIFGIILGATILTIGAVAIYLAMFKQTSPSSANSPTPATAATDDSITVPLKLDYEPNGKTGTQSFDKKLTLHAPLAWRSQIQSPDLNSSCYRSVEPCVSVTFANMLGNPTSLQATNNIAFYDLTNWLVSNNADPNYIAYFAGTTDPVKKKQLIAATLALTSESKLTTSSVDTLFNPFITNAAFSGLSDVQFIQSADGKFKGYSFIASLSQSPAYLPKTYVVLVGQDSHATTYAISGEFVLNDNLKKTNPLESSPDFETNYFKPNYTYPQDTISLNDQALTVVKSIRFSD